MGVVVQTGIGTNTVEEAFKTQKAYSVGQRTGGRLKRCGSILGLVESRSRANIRCVIQSASEDWKMHFKN